MKIISLANDPKSSPTDLVNAVTMDPNLTARILKLINSAYFGNRGVASVNRAVMLLGFNTIKNIALSVAVTSTIKVRDDFKWFTNNEFWEHNLGCAIASRNLAKAMGVGALQVEEYFVAGLVHDMGKGALIHKLGKEDSETIYNPEYEPASPRHEVEKEMLGMSHGEISGIIAQKWKFPESLAAAIAFHHNPMEAPAEHRKLALTVRIADHCCHLLKIGIQTTMNLGNITREEWGSFTMKPEDVKNTLTGLPEAVESARDFLTDVKKK
ncbi:MAG: HDOD domain-containing protein [Nitrospinae bacterium]|nr:HDOD domain-containing protein [Nitrospinota bacterium]